MQVQCSTVGSTLALTEGPLASLLQSSLALPSQVLEDIAHVIRRYGRSCTPGHPSTGDFMGKLSGAFFQRDPADVQRVEPVVATLAAAGGTPAEQQVGARLPLAMHRMSARHAVQRLSAMACLALALWPTLCLHQTVHCCLPSFASGYVHARCGSAGGLCRSPACCGRWWTRCSTILPTAETHCSQMCCCSLTKQHPCTSRR